MASSNSDLKAHAASTTDFYALLELSPSFTPKELDRAWRKTAFKYHPDKVGAADTVARDKFHLANIAYEIFSDPSLRQLYDNAREARERRRKQEELLQGKRRDMKANLERREKAAADSQVRGAKRPRDEELDEQERLEREIRRIAEDGKRRRLEMEEKLRQEIKKEQEEARKQKQEEEAKEDAVVDSQGVTELERSVKVKYARTAETEALDSAALLSMFSVFGNVEHVVILKDKRERLGPKKEKVNVGRALVVYKSVVGAHAAVDGWSTLAKTAASWEKVQDVFWAEGKEPNCLSNLSGARNEPQPTTSASPGPSTPQRMKNNLSFGSHVYSPSSTSNDKMTDGNLRKVPSFASFTSARDTPKASASPAVGSPSLEELTMIRLRNAEKRRLGAEKLARQETGSPS